MTSLIAAGGSGRSTSVIPAVPAAGSLTTVAFTSDLREVLDPSLGLGPLYASSRLPHLDRPAATARATPRQLTLVGHLVRRRAAKRPVPRSTSAALGVQAVRDGRRDGL